MKPLMEQSQQPEERDPILMNYFELLARKRAAGADVQAFGQRGKQQGPMFQTAAHGGKVSSMAANAFGPVRALLREATAPDRAREAVADGAEPEAKPLTGLTPNHTATQLTSQGWVSPFGGLRGLTRTSLGENAGGGPTATQTVPDRPQTQDPVSTQSVRTGPMPPQVSNYRSPPLPPYMTKEIMFPAYQRADPGTRTSYDQKWNQLSRTERIEAVEQPDAVPSWIQSIRRSCPGIAC